MAAVLAAVTVLACLATVPATAEAVGGGCNAPLCAWQDVPATADSTVAAASLYFEGWAVNTNTGARAGSYVLYRTNLNGTGGVFVPVDVFTVYRPDVQAAYGGNTTAYAGWRLIPRTVQPPGDYTYTVLITDAPFSQQAMAIPEHVIVQ
jgi:hypothetical protein